jgi:hypothetical protein
VWNFHPEFEIHLIRESTGTAFIGDYIGEFSPRHLAIVGGGLNLSNFNRNFLKRRRMTPTRYRDLALRKCSPRHGDRM